MVWVHRLYGHFDDRGCRSDSTRHSHVPEASLVVGHPAEGVLSLSRLLADGRLELFVTQVLEPIDIAAQFGTNADPADVDAHVRAHMQQALDELAAKRRIPILG